MTFPLGSLYPGGMLSSFLQPKGSTNQAHVTETAAWGRDSFKPMHQSSSTLLSTLTVVQINNGQETKDYLQQ